MLAPIAYAASISQSLPRILPILQMAAPDYLPSIDLPPDLDLDLEDPAHPMFLEIAPTIDRLHFLHRAFPTTSHSNSSSLPIPLDKVLPMCSPLDDVSDPISFSQFLYHYSDISSPYLSEFTQLRTAPNMMLIFRRDSPLFLTALGTSIGSHLLTPLLLCVTVIGLGVKAARRLFHLFVLL
eukprot:g37787.t1